MTSPETKSSNLKGKVLRGITVYWIYVAYFTLVFAAFTQFRRLILADVGITYANYGIALLEALIFAKVIMVGDALRLGRGLDDKPLIIPTLVKTVVFTLFASTFTLIEHGVKGLWHGIGFLGGLTEFLAKGSAEILAGALILFAAFVPFFALRELGRAFGGEGKLLALLFRARDKR